MEQKQTAVEWLIHQLRQLAHNQSTHLGMGDIRVTQGMLDDFEEQAKEMAQQELKDAYKHGSDDENCRLSDGAMAPDYENADEFYEGEYGGKNE